MLLHIIFLTYLIVITAQMFFLYCKCNIGVFTLICGMWMRVTCSNVAVESGLMLSIFRLLSECVLSHTLLIIITLNIALMFYGKSHLSLSFLKLLTAVDFILCEYEFWLLNFFFSAT